MYATSLARIAIYPTKGIDGCIIFTTFFKTWKMSCIPSSYHKEKKIKIK
jgi:hypothetical protein